MHAAVSSGLLQRCARSSGIASCERARQLVHLLQQRGVLSGVRGSSFAVTSATKDPLGWVAPENRMEVSRVLEQADQAERQWSVVSTDFLSPSVVADALAVLSQRSDVVCVPCGGFAQAERCRLLLGREEVMEGFKNAPETSGAVAALEVFGKGFMFDPAAHGDFLGAIVGTGVVREKVGDIIVQGETGAQVLVVPDLVEHFEMTLKQVRSVPVQTRAIPLSQLAVKAPKTEEVTSVEASLRLDAIASAGFRVSRSKMSDLIKAGDVRVNWRPALKTSQELTQGDVISCRGKGRITLKAVQTTKKERFSVTLLRFV